MADPPSLWNVGVQGLRKRWTKGQALRHVERDMWVEKIGGASVREIATDRGPGPGTNLRVAERFLADSREPKLVLITTCAYI